MKDVIQEGIQQEKERQEQEKERIEQEKKNHKIVDEDWDLGDDFDEPENQEDLYLSVQPEMLQTYFRESLEKLQDEEYEKDPERYTERLIKMQLLETYDLVHNQEWTDAFEREKTDEALSEAWRGRNCRGEIL